MRLLFLISKNSRKKLIRDRSRRFQDKNKRIDRSENHDLLLGKETGLNRMIDENLDNQLRKLNLSTIIPQNLKNQKLPNKVKFTPKAQNFDKNQKPTPLSQKVKKKILNPEIPTNNKNENTAATP